MIAFDTCLSWLDQKTVKTRIDSLLKIFKDICLFSVLIANRIFEDKFSSFFKFLSLLSEAYCPGHLNLSNSFKWGISKVKRIVIGN